MATYTRSNAWNQGGTFDNENLLWYARGVGEMQSRELNDPNSWWFFAAIHGEYVGVANYPGWGSIPGPPQVPTSPVPSQGVKDQFWNQCQHQSWYFPPWHRGYLLALEAQVRAAVVRLGGPDCWALPYWNYFGPDDQFDMPPAFAQEELPGGEANPLFVTARFGPNGDGNIFIPIPPVSQACQNNDIYTGSSPVTPRPGYGGPQTGFWHGGGRSGNLESNPHNQVHVDVGGDNNVIWGLMSDPGLAALDPIFYLHHCNIDRMWAAWNAKGNSNPTDDAWLDGPAASGQREFVMPMPDGTTWVFTPSQVNSLSQLDYTYDDLSTVQAQPAERVLAQRLSRLGATPTDTAPGDAMANQDDSELVGAHDGALEIKSSGARATVRLDTNVRRKVSDSLRMASRKSLPDLVYLRLENVRGNRDAHKLTVYVNEQAAGTVATFGLRRASQKDGQHGGEGLTFELDITGIIDNLHLDESLDADSLDVKVMPSKAVPDDAEFTIGRVSVYREGQ